MDRKGRKREAAALLIALALAMVSMPASAAEHHGWLGKALGSWVEVNQQSGQADGVFTRVGAWFVHMAKSLTGQTDGDSTNASGGMDPTNAGEATTDPSSGALIGLPSGS